MAETALEIALSAGKKAEIVGTAEMHFRLEDFVAMDIIPEF